MRRATRPTVTVLLFVCLSALAAHAAAAALPPDHPAMKLLHKARTAIRDGKAADAVTPLEEVKKLFPGTPEADEADRLGKRIASHEVLIDRSHEWKGETHLVARYLRGAGIGVTISDASLDHLSGRLADYEIVLIWQEQAGVGFTDAEIAMLKEYAKEGGRVLVIGTTRPTPGYPLRRLLEALGCPMKGPTTQVNYGSGKVKFFENMGLFDEARLSDARESAAEVCEVFQKLMPYEALAKSGLDDYVPPEASETVKNVRLEYSVRLAGSAERIRDVLAKLLDQTTQTYKDDLSEGLVVRLLPRGQSGWVGGVVFAPGTLEGQPEMARELGRALTLFALFPEGKWVGYPPWVANGWCDLVALRALYKIGFRQEAENWRKGSLAAWDPARLVNDGIDLSVSRLAWRPDYPAKAMWVLEQIEQKDADKRPRGETRNVLAPLRKTLKRYAAAHRVGDNLSTRDVIFFLSQSLHEDMFAFFQTLGTRVLPMKLDYYELDKDEKK